MANDAWHAGLPPRVKLETIGAKIAGTGDVSTLDADFIMTQVHRCPKRCRWQVEFPSKKGLHRTSLEAAPNSDGTLALLMKIEGRVEGPAWSNPSVPNLSAKVQLAFDAENGITPSAGTDWPESVPLTPSFAAAPTHGHYISPEPLAAEMAMMGAGSGSSDSCDGCSITRHAPPGTGTVIVGQKVNLSISCDEGTVSDVQWSIPSVRVKFYEVSDDSPSLFCESGYCAELFQLGADDLDDEFVLFYWVTAGEKTVTVTFKQTVDGTTKECMKSMTFNVVAPAVETNLPADQNDIGEATILPLNAHAVHLLTGPGPQYTDGIEFRAKVTGPNDSGDWQFTQTVISSRKIKEAATGDCTENPVTENALDTSFTYQAGPFSADGEWQKVVDSPGGSVNPANYSQMFADDLFFMYIMYVPPGQAIWVPLKLIIWRFAFCAVPNAAKDSWIIKDNDSEITSFWANETTHPQWNTRVNSTDPWNEANCPPACSE